MTASIKESRPSASRRRDHLRRPDPVQPDASGGLSPTCWRASPCVPRADRGADRRHLVRSNRMRTGKRWRHGTGGGLIEARHSALSSKASPSRWSPLGARAKNARRYPRAADCCPKVTPPSFLRRQAFRSLLSTKIRWRRAGIRWRRAGSIARGKGGRARLSGGKGSRRHAPGGSPSCFPPSLLAARLQSARSKASSMCFASNAQLRAQGPLSRR